jgi:hypothetical protein
LPEHLALEVRSEMLRFLPEGLSQEERGKMLDDLLKEFIEARQSFADAKILREGPSREQVLAALVEMKGRVDRVIEGLEALDDVSVQALMISNHRVQENNVAHSSSSWAALMIRNHRVQEKGTRRDLADHFQAVWDLQKDIDHALVQFKRPNPDDRRWPNWTGLDWLEAHLRPHPDDRRWPNWLRIAPVMKSSVIFSKGDPLRNILFCLAQGIELVTARGSDQGTVPTANWSPIDDAVQGSFVPVAELLVRALALDGADRFDGDPARVAREALRDYRSWKVEHEEMVRQGCEEEARRQVDEEARLYG